MPSPTIGPNDPILLQQRLSRLRSTMRAHNVDALFTADPINMQYACGARNMTVFSMMGPSRFLLVFAEGPVIMWEFAGCEHMVANNPVITDVRAAPGITPNSGSNYRSAIRGFAAEIASAMHVSAAGGRLGVERVDFEMTDALRTEGVTLTDATGVFLESRLLKQPSEISLIREAVARVESGVAELREAIVPGRSENEIWSTLHKHLVATDGEYISTRLLQAGPNTFPYFRESSDRQVQQGELLCLDTDAIGYGGYGVDFSRTFLVGENAATREQLTLHRRAYEQLDVNASLLGPGVSYADFAAKAWPIPEEHRSFGYYCLVHGLGMSGEHPYVPLRHDSEPYDFPGEFEPNMVVCVESYIGSADAQQGVKLEDQYLITNTGAERLTTFPFDPALTN